MSKTTLSYGEAAVVSTICFGCFTLWSIQAVLAGFPTAEFSDSGNGWLIATEVVLGAAALLFLKARGFDIGSLYPRPTWRDSALGIGLYLAILLAGSLPMSLLEGATADTGGSLADVSFRAALPSVIAMAMVNGAFEEIFLLGVLVRGLRGFGLSVALGVPLLVRLMYHLYQGPGGLVWIAIFGLVLSLSYLACGRLWPAVFAHMLADIVPVVANG